MAQGLQIRPARLALAAVALAFAGVAWLMWSLISYDRERDFLDWQTRLSVVASARTAAVEGWLRDQVEVLDKLSRNEALQIYAAGAAGIGGLTRDAAQDGYLQNLLTFAAQNSGFVERQPLPSIAANVRQLGTSGLLILSAEKTVLSASLGAPVIDGHLAEVVGKLTPATRGLLDLYPGPTGRVSAAFAAPLYFVNSTQGGSLHVGWVVGVKAVGEELFPLLQQPGDPYASSEALLVQGQGESIVFLSPRRDSAEPLTRRLAMNTPELAESFAWNHPDGFARKRDYSGEAVLVTGRRVAGAPWVLLYKVREAEALADTNERGRYLILVLALAFAVAAVSVFAAWRIRISRENLRMAEEYRALSERLSLSETFLRHLRDEEPSPTFTVFRDLTVSYANAAAADLARASAADIVGKTLAQVFGTAFSKRLADNVLAVFDARENLTATYDVEEQDGHRHLQTKHILIPGSGDRTDMVLVVEDDVTPIIEGRRRAHESLRGTIEVLVSVIDQFDPMAQKLSLQVSTLSEWLAQALNLDDASIEAVRYAAILANVGRSLVPSELLRKTGPLTEAEKETVREALDRSYALFSGVVFEGPVLEILAQVRENWDGSGHPEGRAGEAIHPGARIVAVATAFAALVSPRWHRQAFTINEALDTLFRETGSRYDKRIVIALMHVLENEKGRERWEALAG